jgi:hypothetical protein
VSKIHRIDLTNAWEPAGPHTWIRRFGRPSGLGPEDRVWLVLESPPAADRSVVGVVPEDQAGSGRGGGKCGFEGCGDGAFALNGRTISTFAGRTLRGASGRRRADVSLLLRPRNELVLVSGGSPTDGAGGVVPPLGVRQPLPYGSVFLEIESPS